MGTLLATRRHLDGEEWEPRFAEMTLKKGCLLTSKSASSGSWSYRRSNDTHLNRGWAAPWVPVIDEAALVPWVSQSLYCSAHDVWTGIPSFCFEDFSLGNNVGVLISPTNRTIEVWFLYFSEVSYVVYKITELLGVRKHGYFIGWRLNMLEGDEWMVE